jgi:hypothetical protein
MDRLRLYLIAGFPSHKLQKAVYSPAPDRSSHAFKGALRAAIASQVNARGRDQASRFAGGGVNFA